MSQEQAPWTVARPPNYADFTQRVRRYRPSDLVPAVARVACGISDRDDGSPERWRYLSPWGLAATARESLVRGNEYRDSSTVGDADVVLLHNLFAGSYDRVPEAATNEGLGILTRYAYEQFAFLESDFEEIARTLAMLDGALREAETQDLSSSSLQELLGGRLVEVLGAALLIYSYARASQGRWRPEWLDTQDASTFLSEVPRNCIDVVASIMTATPSDLRADYRKAYQKTGEPPDRLRRFAYNPLVKFPIVRFPENTLVVPQPRYVLRRVSPAGLFYVGVERYGKVFADDLGKVVETYVGQTLRLIDGADVHPEIIFGKSQERSIDWFVVLPDLVVLVEVKSTRLTMGARAGDTDLVDVLQDKLGKAIRQINRSTAHLREGHKSFTHIPADRPIVGLVVTAEPFYTANSSLARAHLQQAEVPTLIASLRDLERLCAHDGPTVADALAEIANDSDLSTWILSSSLGSRLPAAGPNTILRSAMNGIPLKYKDL